MLDAPLPPPVALSATALLADSPFRWSWITRGEQLALAHWNGDTRVTSVVDVELDDWSVHALYVQSGEEMDSLTQRELTRDVERSLQTDRNGVWEVVEPAHVVGIETESRGSPVGNSELHIYHRWSCTCGARGSWGHALWAEVSINSAMASAKSHINARNAESSK